MFFIPEPEFFTTCSFSVPCVTSAGTTCTSSATCWRQLWYEVGPVAHPGMKFIFRNANWSAHPSGAGQYAWVNCNNTPACTNDSSGLNYLDNFFNLASSTYSSYFNGGASWKGFNASNSGFNSPLATMAQSCGSQWLNTFAKAGSYFNAQMQVPFMQVATWNDYDEGTEIETGIDNCYSIAASAVPDPLGSNTMTWSLNASDSSASPGTIDHLEIWGSTECSSYLWTYRATLSISTTSWGTSSAGAYAVKMVGKNSIINRLSNTVSLSPEVNPRPCGGE